MRPTRFFLAALVLTLAGCHSLPATQGDGRLRFVRVPWIPPNYLVGRIRTGSDDGFVTIQAGPSTQFVYDGNLRVLDRGHGFWSDFALAEDAPLALGISCSGNRLLSLPSLDPVREIPDPPGISPLFSRLTARPGGGFVIVGKEPSGPNVSVLTGDPPAWRREGRTVMNGILTAIAVDDATDTLLRTEDPPRVELFDLGSMTTRVVLDLPGKPDFALVAAGGFAFVGLEDGRIVPVDVRAGRVLPVAVRGTGRMDLARSLSGGLVAVAWQQRERGWEGPYPTRLAVFRRSGPSLTRIASVSFDLPRVLDDIAILEARGEVLLTAGRALLALRW